MRMTCGASGGREAARAFAAAITSITMNGGAEAPRPVFNVMQVGLLRLRRSANSARYGLHDCNPAGTHAAALGSATFSVASTAATLPSGRADAPSYKKHAAARFGAVWNSGGTAARQRGITEGQRSAKRQPLEMLARSPCTGSVAQSRTVLTRGI